MVLPGLLGEVLLDLYRPLYGQLYCLLHLGLYCRLYRPLYRLLYRQLHRRPVLVAALPVCSHQAKGMPSAQLAVLLLQQRVQQAGEPAADAAPAELLVLLMLLVMLLLVGLCRMAGWSCPRQPYWAAGWLGSHRQ
jgi:hypothetical protein